MIPTQPCNCDCDNPNNKPRRWTGPLQCLSCFMQDNNARPEFYELKNLISRIEQHYMEKAQQACQLLGHGPWTKGIRDACADEIEKMKDLTWALVLKLEDKFPKASKEPYEPHMEEDGE